MATSATMNRLLLPRKTSRAAEQTFVPDGDCLASWFNMSLIQKMPMFPFPQGAVELYKDDVGKQAYRNATRIDFDLDDPNNFQINCEYDPLHDPHLLHLYKTPRYQAVLKALGKLTPDQKVRCSVRDFNKYRAFLRRISHNEFRKQQAEQRKRIPKIHAGDRVEVSYIETRIHEREVRSREQKMEEARQEKIKSQLCQTERRLEIRRRRKQFEYDEGNFASKRCQIQRHRANVYTKHMMMVRQRARKHFRAWKRKMRRHLQHMKELEETRLNEADRKLRDGWEKRRLSDAQRLVDDAENRRREEERAHRYQRMFEAEMVKRWQKQAGQIQERKERARQTHIALVREYSRNLAKAFAGSRLINPAGQQLAIEGKKQLAIEAAKKESQQLAIEGKALPAIEAAVEGEEVPKDGPEKAESTVKIPKLISVHTEETKQSKWAFEEPLESLEVNVRLHKPQDKKSADEMKKLQDAMDDAFRAVSGDALDNLPGLKKKAVVKRAAYSGKYPTRVENLDKTGRNVKPEDEIRMFISHEEFLSKAAFYDNVERTYSDHHVVQFSNRPSVIERDEPVARGSLRPVSEHELTPAPSQEALVDLGPTSLEHLSAEDKDLMETLLMKLLSDTRDGSIAREDLIKLTSLCSTLWGAINFGQEEGTSTTSLAAREIVNMSLERVRADIVMGKVPDADLILATSALARTASEGSLTSEKLEMYLNDTLDRAWNEKEDADDEFNAWLVEETIKSTVDQLTTDLVSGNLSRAEVREIGSAVASVVLGEVRSDDSMLADEVIVPTLQQFLQDSESIDETLLDHTLATLLSSYTHVVRRLDKPVWDIIKDFVVEILLRSKMNLREMTSDPDEFVEALRIERVAAGRDDMDLPQQEELLEVLATAVSKFVGCLRPTPVLCDLMRAILGPAQDDLARRRSAECLTIPKINPSMIDQVGESACCLEVALEITASVCDGLALEMAADKEFRDTTIMRLGPAFLFIILANWEEVSAGVDKDTVAIQTSKEFRKDPVVRPSQAESLVLLCMHRLWQDSQGDYLPDNTIVLMATQVAEFPALAPVQLHGLDREVHGVHLPGHVCRKIVKLDEMLTRGSLGYDEAKKLLAIVLHIYIREVLCSDGTLKKEPKSCDCSTHDMEEKTRADVLSLITNSSRIVLNFVRERVLDKLDDMEMDVDVNFYSVTEALQTVAEEAYTDLGGMNLDIEIAEDDLSQLEFIIRATSKDQVDVSSQMDVLIIRAFFDKILAACQSMEGSFPNPSDICKCKSGEDKIINDLILKELWKVSREITSLFSALSGPQEPTESSPVSDRMVTFLISLMLELRRVVMEEILPQEAAYDFLKTIAPEVCTPSARSSARALNNVIVEVVQDIEFHRSGSCFFIRIARQLSRMSLERKYDDQLPQGMAATAHLLSTMDSSILNQFIQTTLQSLLRGIHRASLGGESGAQKPETPDDSHNRRPTPSSASSAPPKTPVLHDLSECPKKGEDSVSIVSREPEPEDVQEQPKATICEDTSGRLKAPDYEDTTKEDALVEKEVIQQSRVIAHVAIQKTLERLGATPTGDILNQEVIHTVVRRIRTESIGDLDSRSFASSDISTDDSMVRSSNLQQFDYHLASYADGLVHQVSKHFEDKEDAVPMAKMILCNTLDTIEASIQQGTLSVAQSVPIDEDVDVSDEFFEPEVSHQLSNVICTTLRAVKSELCLVQLQQESSDEKPEISKQSVGKARGIVEFLFKKVEQDVEEAKVGFHITPGKKLSILPLSPRASHLYRARLASVWRSSNASLPHNILVTFRDVLQEMHELNKFLRPVQPRGSQGGRSSFTVPGLPFLLDEYILNNLQEIAAQISLAASVKDIDHKTLSESNAIVARSFHAVIRHMQEEAEHEQRRLGEVRKAKEEQESSGRVEELWERDEEREMHGRRMIVLSVLDRTFQQCYSDLFQREDALVETEDEEAEEEEMMTEMIKQDDMSKVIHFMERVVSKVSGGREDHDTEDTVADDDSYITDVVVQATLRTLDHVKAGELVEDDLDKLCRAFFLDMTDSSAREEKQEVLEKHLRALLVDVREGRVQRKTLQQATKELGLKTFDKKTRPVLSVTRSRDQEFLRRALSGILQGLTRQGPAESRPEQQTLAVKKIDFKRRCISESYSPHDRPIVERGRSKSVGSPTVAMPEFQRKTPLSRGAAKSHSSERHGEEEPDYVHVGLNRAQSIEERTISKTNVADDTANRKSSTGGRFELYATTQSLPPLCDQESDQLLVVTEGSEPGSTLSYLSQVPSKTEEVDEPEEGEEQAGGTADVDSDEGDTKSDATSEAGDDQSMASERDASEPENEPAAASGRETPVPSESENEREDAGSEAEAEGSEKAESEAGVSEAGDADVQEGDAGSEAGEEGVSEAGDESERTASENEQDDVASDAGDGSEKEASENEQDEVASDAGDGSEKEASEHAPEDVAYEAGDGSDKAESESEADGSETQQEDAASEAGDEGIGSEKGESDKEDPEALEAASEHGDQNENKAKTESLPSAASDATDIMCTTRRPTDRTETAQPRKTAETSGKAKLTAAKTKASASKAGSSKTVSKHGERKTEDDENGEDESVQLDSKGVSRTVSMTSGSKASLEASRDFNRSAVRSTRKAWMVYVDEVPEQEHLSLLYKGRSRSRHSRPPFTTHLQGVQSSHTRPSQFTSSHLLAGEDKRGFRSSSSHRNFTAAVNPLLNDWRKIIKQIGRPAFGAGAEENGSLVVRRKKARHESRKKKHKKKKKMKKKKEAEYSIQLVPPRIETPHPPSEQRRLDVAKFWVGDMAMTRREGRTAMVSSSTLVNRPQNSRSCTPTSRDLSRTSVPSEAGPKEGRQRSATIIRRETSSVTVCTLSSTDSATTLADAASMRRSTCGNVAENETQNATEGRKKSLSESAACESRDTTGEPISQQNANQHHMGHSRRFPRYPTFTAPAFAIQRAANALSASTTSFPDVMDLKACQRRSYDFGKTLFDRKQKEKWLEHQKHKEETRSFLQCVKIPHPPPQPTPHEAGRPSTKYVEWGNSKIVSTQILPEESAAKLPHPPDDSPATENTGYLPVTVSVKQTKTPGILRAPDVPSAAWPPVPPKTEPLRPLRLDDTIHTVPDQTAMDALRGQSPSPPLTAALPPQTVRQSGRFRMIKARLPAPPPRFSQLTPQLRAARTQASPQPASSQSLEGDGGSHPLPQSPLDTQRLATATACAARRVRKMLSRGQVEAPVFPMAVDKRVRMGSVGKQEG